MSHVLMLCHDQHLDRRVVAQAQSLVGAGHEVSLLALSFNSEDESSVMPEGIRLYRIGLKHIVPDNPIYNSYVTRQDGLNRVLNAHCNRMEAGRKLWNLSFRMASKGNWALYKASLLYHYRNRHITDPLPFRSAFVNQGRLVCADLVQVHDLPALEAGAQLAAEWRVPLVYDAHELYPEQRSFSKVQRDICGEAENRLVRLADLVFAVNESIGQEMAKRYGIPQPRTLLNAIDPPAGFNPQGSYNLLREKLGVGRDRKILLFQGGFAPHRNLEQLVDAMAWVKAPDVNLVMMGFGDFGDVLKVKASKNNLVGKRIHFLPAVPQSELLQHSASADLGIIPYPHVDLNSYYCTPNKLFEFIQAGLPIVANDSPELHRFVGENGFGLVVPTHTSQQIAEAVDQAFASGQLSTWRSNLLARREQYSWSAESRGYLQAMEPLLQSGNAA